MNSLFSSMYSLLCLDKLFFLNQSRTSVIRWTAFYTHQGRIPISEGWFVGVAPSIKRERPDAWCFPSRWNSLEESMKEDIIEFTAALSITSLRSARVKKHTGLRLSSFLHRCLRRFSSSVIVLGSANHLQIWHNYDLTRSIFFPTPIHGCTTRSSLWRIFR